MQAIVPDVCPWMTESFGDFPTEGAGVRRNLRLQEMLGALVLALVTLVLAVPMASAQDLDDIVSELERSGYYIEPGADATESEMRSLVDRGNNTAVAWYFVVLSGPAEVGYAATIRDAVRPTGNVLLHSVESDSQGAFDQVDFATGLTRSIEERALAAFDTNWSRPVDYMVDVVTDFTAATSGPASAGSEGSSGSSSGSASSGGGFPWGLVVILVVIGGGLWFMSRRGKRKKQGIDLETAQKIRAELQTEIDELANDVLVLSGPVDLSDKPQAIEFYREATDTYLDISAEIPDMEELTLTLANCLISGLVWPMPGGRWMQPRRFSMESLFLKSQRSSRHRLRPHLNSGPRNSASKDCPSVPRGPVCPTVRHDAVAAVACSIS